MDADAFWKRTRAIFYHQTPRNRELLAIRDEMQKKIDDWHLARKGQPLDMEEYEAFLRAIGYLRPEPAPFAIAPRNVDDEVARIAGPQLVVPILKDRKSTHLNSSH